MNVITARNVAIPASILIITISLFFGFFNSCEVKPINKLFTQGRSKRITVVAGMQRPAWISRFALSQSTHAFIFRCEGRDLTSLSQALSPRIVPYVDKLSGHQFVYFNRATREIKFGDANRLKDIFDVPAKVTANG